MDADDIDAAGDYGLAGGNRSRLIDAIVTLTE